MTLGLRSGGCGWAVDCLTHLLAWLGIHHCQPVTEIKLQSTLEYFFLAVGFELNRGGAVFCVDDHFVEQAHGG